MTEQPKPKDKEKLANNTTFFLFVQCSCVSHVCSSIPVAVVTTTGSKMEHQWPRSFWTSNPSVEHKPEDDPWIGFEWLLGHESLQTSYNHIYVTTVLVNNKSLVIKGIKTHWNTCVQESFQSKNLVRKSCIKYLNKKKHSIIKLLDAKIAQ